MPSGSLLRFSQSERLSKIVLCGANPVLSVFKWSGTIFADEKALPEKSGMVAVPIKENPLDRVDPLAIKHRY
jgi:hypothetical protein